MREEDVVDVEEHVRIEEVVVPGACGRREAVIMSIDDDIRVHEEKHETATSVSDVSGGGGHHHHHRLLP